MPGATDAATPYLRPNPRKSVPAPARRDYSALVEPLLGLLRALSRREGERRRQRAREQRVVLLTFQEDQSAQEIAAEIERMRGGKVAGADGTTRDLRNDDFMVVTPYNGQVRCLRERLPEGVRIGIVFELHGQMRLLDVFDPDGNRVQLAQDLAGGS